MKILPFKIPKTSNQSFWFETDYNKHFYEFLHQHPEVQVTLIMEGEGKLIIGDYVSDFKPDEIYVIGSNQPHVFMCDPKYFKVNSQLMAHSISVFFEWKIFGNTFMQLPEMKHISDFAQLSERGLRFDKNENMEVERLLKKIFKAPQCAKFFILLSLLNEMASSQEYSLLANAGTAIPFSEAEGKRLDAIYRFTMNEFQRKITLEEVAGVANLTVNSFCRYFKKRTRKSYIDFLTDVRIGQAAKLLQLSDLSISDVCDKVGFTNLSNFNRKFKEKNGAPPSQYRKNHIKLISNK
jgi:AraC-like DNA-binding protein